jgi:membrane-bound lytic murein transglycosylase MltF
MSDDIVERLRLTPVLIRADEMGQSRIDYEACKKFVNQEGVKLMREAANEIERLREALRIEQEELAACFIDRKETQRERDEARRLYINEMCLRDYGDTSARIREAKARGWNCFDGDGWSDPGDECQREAL